MPEKDIPVIWKDDYLGTDSPITFTQIVYAFVDGVPGMAAVDISNCLIHLMSFCRNGNPQEIHRATEFLNHADIHYYGIRPNWNMSKNDRNPEWEPKKEGENK